MLERNYPKLLREISNPPAGIYVEGNEELLNTNCISIVGSRCCSEEGAKIAKKFAKELAKQEITVVSGMAKGIDSAAHQGALRAGGNTIAVLGCGFHHIYPPENIPLYKQILEQNGAVITEYAPEVVAKSEYFLARNRIVSGLSLGLLVVEAAHRSGTSVTAKIARSQERKVFCIPHEFNNYRGVRNQPFTKARRNSGNQCKRNRRKFS